jgi:hypothetical protein
LVDANHIHRWKLDEASGNFLDTGSSGSKVDLTLTGTPVRQALTPWGNVGTIFGIDTLGATNTNHGRALISAFSDLPSTNVTIEGWVQTYQASFNGMFGADHTTNSNFTVEGGLYPTMTLNAGSFHNVGSITAFSPAYGVTWHHVAAVYNGTHQYLYFNGELMARQGNTGSVQWTNGTTPRFVVGRKQTGGPFIGCMSRVFLSDIARSQSYLRQVAAAGLH